MSNVSHHPCSHCLWSYSPCDIPTDFKNPNDPHDRSFDPHPTDYPVGELEFPNSGATERYVFHFFCPRTSMASGNALCHPSRGNAALFPLNTNTHIVPPAALKHDQAPPAAIDDSCSPSPPRVCPGSTVRHLATSPCNAPR